MDVNESARVVTPGCLTATGAKQKLTGMLACERVLSVYDPIRPQNELPRKPLPQMLRTFVYDTRDRDSV